MTELENIIHYEEEQEEAKDEEEQEPDDTIQPRSLKCIRSLKQKEAFKKANEKRILEARERKKLKNKLRQKVKDKIRKERIQKEKMREERQKELELLRMACDTSSSDNETPSPKNQRPKLIKKEYHNHTHIYNNGVENPPKTEYLRKVEIKPLFL